MMTSEPDRIPRPGQKPGSQPPQIPGGLATPESSSLLPFTALRQTDVGEGDHNPTGDQVVSPQCGQSEQRKAEPEPDGPEFLWSCMEGDTYGSPHALASHCGKSGRLEGNHSPWGMVDATSGRLVWEWSNGKSL